MFTQIFDTHSHYTDSAFDADRHEVLSALPEAGIVHAVLAGTTLEDSTAGIALADRYDYIYAAVGIHPETAGQQPADYLAQLERLAKHPKVVAIGEIGLDYHYEGYDRGSQSVLLREQLDLARQLDLPVIIHARDCTEDYLRILQEFRPRGVVHCFSGSVEMARDLVGIGMYIGLGGAVTFKNARRPIEVAAWVPEDRLLIETDAPLYDARTVSRQAQFLGAHSLHGGENRQVRGMTPEQVLRMTRENAERLFGVVCPA